MTRSRRVMDVFSGIVMFLVGTAFFFSSADSSMLAMLFLIQLGMTVRGIRAMYYYLTMARYTVGGKQVLYRGFIWLDLGVVAGSLIGHNMIYTVLYLALLHVFNGVVSILRANESRTYGARWRVRMAYGVTDILIAAAVVVSGVVLKQPIVMAYIYGAGLMYTAVLRIASAFRRTDIVYIQ